MKDLLTISKERYTTKHYDPARRISDSDFKELLEVVRLAPSAVNIQPWFFYTGSSKKAKDLILPAIPDFNIPRIEESSHYVILCARTAMTDEDYTALINKEVADGRYTRDDVKAAVDEHRRVFGNMHRDNGDFAEWTAKQAYIAMTALLYAAASKGIDSTPTEGMDFKKTDEILGLKDKNLRTVAMVTLGYRAADDSNAKRPKSRLAFEDIFASLD